MTAIDRILSDFVDDWNAGRRPQVPDFLDRAAPSERDELAARLAEWLAVAPAPELDAAARAAIRAEAPLAAALRAIESESGLWPELLPRLRERAGLKLSELAERVTSAFGLAGQEERAAAYLARMESGRLDAARVSRRLLDVLGRALGVGADELAEAGDLGGAGLRPAPAGGVLFRAERARGGDAFARDLEALSEAAMTPAPPPMDELDRLFTGGPDA
jgi:transcriptional regulator with XRE-family HTH domain